MQPTRVLITGANRGLGEKLVQVCAAQGAVVFAGSRAQSGKPARALSASVTQLGLDVTDAASLRASRQAVEDLAGGLDILINNAAINPSHEYEAELAQLDFAAIAKTFDVNAIGPLRVTQSMLPLLRRGKDKLVVNVSSEAGSLAHSWRDRSYGYCMSKAALNMQTTILRKALGTEGFRVVSVHPGWLRTDMGGPNAELDPYEAARVLWRTLQDIQPDGPAFIQHDGRPFPW